VGADQLEAGRESKLGNTAAGNMLGNLKHLEGYIGSYLSLTFANMFAAYDDERWIDNNNNTSF